MKQNNYASQLFRKLYSLTQIRLCKKEDKVETEKCSCIISNRFAGVYVSLKLLKILVSGQTIRSTLSFIPHSLRNRTRYQIINIENRNTQTK